MSHFPIWCLDWTQALAERGGGERGGGGRERQTALCQVCIHTHHVSERAFYITLNLDQMAYTQWAAAHGYWDIVISMCFLVCLYACVWTYGVSVCVSLCVSALSYVWTEWLQALCICVHAYVFVSVCECVALWRVDAALLHWQRAQFSPSPSLSGFQLLTAAGQQPDSLIAEYETHISCPCLLFLIISRSFSFMPNKWQKQENVALLQDASLCR